MKQKSCIKLLLVLINLSLFISASVSQGTELDSLENLINDYKKSDTARVNLLNEIAYRSYRTNIEKTFAYATQADSLSDIIGFKKGKAESLGILGIYYSIKRDYPNAFDSFNSSAKISEQIGDKKALAKTLKNLGTTHYRQSNYDEALKYYHDALQVYSEINDITGQTECYNNIGSMHRSMSNYDQALKNFNESLILARKINYKELISFGLNNIGLIHFDQGKYNEAIGYYKRAVEVTKESDDQTNITKYYNNIGSCYNVMGDYPMALEYFQKSLKRYEKTGNKIGMSSVYNNIGVIYDTQGDFDKALNYYNKSLKINTELSDKRGVAIALNNLGAIYKSQGDTALALENFSKSLIIYKEIGDKYGTSTTTSNIGDIYSERGDYEKALIYYKRALEIAFEKGLQSVIARCYINMSGLYFGRKEYPTSITYGEKAYSLSVEINDKGKIMESAKILSDVYAAMQNYKKAYSYYVEFKSQSDSLFNEEEVKKITGLEYQYQYQKEKELAKAEQEKKDAIQAAEIKRQKTIRNSILGGFVLVLILFTLMWYMFMQKRRSNRILSMQKLQIESKNQELSLQKEEIQTQAEKLKAINEKLIELDDFKQGVTSMIVHDLKNPLNAIINSDESEPLKTLKWSKQAGKQMLNLVLNILDVHKYEDTKMQVEKSQVSLFDISCSAVDEVIFLANQKNIKINNNIRQEKGVKADKEIVERVFTNLLTNAIKYTPNNGSVIIDLNQEEYKRKPGFNVITVTDTGEGIPKEKTDLIFTRFGQVAAKKSGSVRSSGLGLTFCKMAIEAHGCEIGVKSDPGSGTTFWFTLPEANNIEVVKNQTTDNPIPINKIVQLTNSDKDFLRPYVEQLKQFMIFEVTEVKRILESIKNTNSPGVEAWIKEIDDCTYSMNEEKYLSLLEY